ncbi:MAG: L-histidine N(alpha)-methyltransferase [Myxococcota bacterium]|nr:L-histidine N(alpha)-methyltransferase [Myxococcota bacterium]
MSHPTELSLTDHEPETETFLRDVLRGLRLTPKELPCKYFYDEAGSALFDRICALPEYYPTRTELSIMERHAPEIAETLGEDVLLVEYGSGSSAKTRVLLDHLIKPAGYVPVDISREHLLASTEALKLRHPEIEMLPVCADFTEPFEVPTPSRADRHRVLYFPGSTLGNFTRGRAITLLSQMAEACAPDGSCLIGIDRVKDVDVLVAAYDDAAGVTAAFNKNLLVRINQELGGDLDLDAFRHEARWNVEEARIEMYLVSTRRQTARIGGEEIAFEAGEDICTEHSHKYTPEGFAEMARAAGLEVTRSWTDPADWFSVQMLRIA